MPRYFKVGDRVRVTCTEKYKEDCSGWLGEIARIYDTHYAVAIDGRKNPRLKHGLYWFDANQLKFDDGHSTMEVKTMLFGNYKRAGIRFLTGDNKNIEYHYALFDDCAGMGDMVVVKTGHHGFALAQIVNIDDNIQLIQCDREVVCRVCLELYNARQEAAARVAELHAQMEKKAKQMQAISLYETLAKADPEMGAMLSEYKRLLGI